MLEKQKDKKQNEELKQIKNLLKKLVYLNEFHFKSAGVTIQYPEEGKESKNENK